MTGNKLLERVVEGQIRKGVQALEVVMKGTVKDAERRARERTGSVDGEEMEGPEWGGYWEELLDGVEDAIINDEKEPPAPVACLRKLPFIPLVGLPAGRRYR